MKRKNVDMLHGPISKGLVIMFLPILIMNVMTTMFTVVDMTVLRIFADDSAVGSVGASGMLITLCTSLVVGVSSGANVTLAKSLGKGDQNESERIASTAILVALYGGILLLIIGVIFAETFLRLTDCPGELLSGAVLYFRLYFLGIPLSMINSYCSSILRASGNTRSPMNFVIIGGVVKVITNFILVAFVGLDVEGVGIATIVSWLVMGLLSFIAVLKSDIVHVRLKKIKFYVKEFKEMIFIGVPSGLQTAMYSFANVIIMTAVNGFGAAATTGVSIANQFDGIMYHIIYAPSLATTPYVAQNLGANNIPRVKQTVLRSVIITATMGLVFGSLSAFFSGQLSSIMSGNPEVIMYSQQKMVLVSSTYFLSGINEIMGGVLKGMGKPIIPTVATMVYMCAIRFVWVYLIFPMCPPSLTYLYLIWPIGWILSIVTLLIFYFPAIKKLAADIQNHKNAEKLQTAN